MRMITEQHAWAGRTAVDDSVTGHTSDHVTLTDTFGWVSPGADLLDADVHIEQEIWQDGEVPGPCITVEGAGRSLHTGVEGARELAAALLAAAHVAEGGVR